MNIGKITLTGPMRLAPMADITNAPFRLVARECGSAMSTSEEIEVKAFLLANIRSLHATAFFPEERPIALQLLGHDPDELAQGATKAEGLGADIVDLNMGCPVPKVTKKGEGAALMKDPAHAVKIFKAMRKAISIPLTVKIRGGWDDAHLNAVEIARLAEAEGIDAITVHPRSRAQRFMGLAPWQTITDVVRAVKIPVTGNGDVKSHADARRMMQETGCQSVMIGRGALGRPWVFNETLDAMAPEQRWDYKLGIVTRHKDLMESNGNPKRRTLQVKKHLVWYSSSMHDAARIRHQIFLSKSSQEAWDIFIQAWELWRRLYLEPKPTPS
ncbi:MAG: tRNA dihydrouridine synthase DusB, partial [Elusimicrobiota bacterium]